MKKKFSLAFFILSILFFKVEAQTKNISQLSFYSPLISTFDMKYINNHLVVSQNGLLIFDVSNVNKKPVLVAQVPYPGSTAPALAVQGNYAYMAGGNNGIFAVYDISDFSSPVLTGSVAIPATSFYGAVDVETHGNYVYMSGFDSLYVINVSNPSSPKVVNALEVSHTEFNGAEDIVIDNTTLFVRVAFGIEVYNINNPAAPMLINFIPHTHAYNKGLSVDTINHRIFSPWLTALQDFMGYDAYDVINPSEPQFLFRDSTVFGGGDFGISAYSYLDNVLFLSKGGGINVFNVSTTSPGFLTSFTGADIPNASVSIEVKDSVFFNARGGGLEVLKFSGTLPAMCLPPTNLKQQVNGTIANLQWNKVKDVSGYIVRYKVKGTNNWITVPSKNNTKKLTNLSPSTYTWQVRSDCGPSVSDWSERNTFEVRPRPVSDLISFAPNPVQDALHVYIKDFSVSKILISDLEGSPLIKINSAKQDETISFSQLKTGTYILQVLNRNNEVIGITKIFRE